MTLFTVSGFVKLAQCPVTQAFSSGSCETGLSLELIYDERAKLGVARGYKAD